MAVDGSFCLAFEFERFIARCPDLASVPKFSNLLIKGNNITEEEVVYAVAELILNPKYTIQLIGGFRPIAQKILDRAVGILHLVPNLKSNSNDTMDMDIDNEEINKSEGGDDIHLIDFYATNNRGLDLHELACLAFSRILDLIPSLLGSVLIYFKFAPPPFQRIISRELMSGKTSKDWSKLLGVVRVSYRLLLIDPEVFTTLWDWSCVVDIEKMCPELHQNSDAELLKMVQDIRWCGTQIISLVLKLSDTATEKLGLSDSEAFTCFLRWKEFCEDVSLEKAGWYLEPDDVKSSESSCNDVSLQSLSLGSLDIRSAETGETPSWAATFSGNPFVLTSTVKKSFEMVVLAVSQRWPVLLYGPAGAGKTALITKLAQDYGSRVLSIHMDDQIDGKTLIGSYVCTEQPGKFRWQPGSLTQAVMNGLWVVFEDIDKAPSDVQSILLPLLEGSSTFLTGHGEAVRVAEGFRLFSTVSSSKLDSDGRNSLSTLWRRVMIGSSSNMDLLSIVNAWYPSMGPLSNNLIETFKRVNQITGFHIGTSGSLSPIGRFSLRDLLKWCKRIAGLGFSFGGDGISAYAISSIYLEAVDIFAAFSSSVENRLTIMRAIAKMWAVPLSNAEIYPVNKPAIQDLRSELRIGRITLQRTQTAHHREKKPFVEIRTSLHVLERIACSVKYNEPILLVGETGTGKTTLVQNLAMRLDQKITVLNLSQQSDVADLLGGFKPMSAQFVCYPLYMEFENLFTRTLSVKENVALFTLLQNYLSNKNWKKLLSVLQKSVKKVNEIGRSKCGTKRKRSESEEKRPWSEELLNSWEELSRKLETARAQISASDGMIFSFVEGAFVTALKNGEWILLDEVNLAPPETLQRVIGVLEEESGSLCLAERGDVDYIRRHPNFRLFACMNPATDAGKRDLPFSIRSRFTEYFVDDVLNDDDLILFINQFIVVDQKNRELINKIVQFYKAAKKASEERLQDGANQKPQYSLRSLYRALEYTGKARKEFKFKKALYDGFCMFFLNLLDETSAKSMNDLIILRLLGEKLPPPQVPFDRYLKVRENSEPNEFLGNYVLTKSVKEHLGNLARAIFVGKYPVLLQGPTSSGKTSLVQFLAATTGHEFVRINNHQHTDLQEYLGSYITDASGKLIFHEGVLVKAVRSGHWIVLDELNLAPSDVLEALNRLLDDNRELFVPELRETIRAHPDFMLFATQNPPTFYGGRKMLSRAFRNRFVEIHVDEIPQDELNTILENRCKIPGSYAKKMVEVMKLLQLHRQSSKVFAGKHGFITPRDLFRWADRFRMFGKSYEDLSLDGYYLLAERLRDDAEKNVVQRVLETQLHVKLGKEDMYKQELGSGNSVSELSRLSGTSEDLGTIIWTRSMWRLYFLVERCYKLREPVLLVGETGGGKTTVCQLLSICLAAKLHILNCHQYTETSDFLGGFYPVRERSKLSSDFKDLCEEIMLSKALIHISGGINISTDIHQASSTLSQLSLVINNYKQGPLFHPDVSLEEIKTLEERIAKLIQLNQKWQTIFMWQDGPLVEAMKNGDLFLIDEISLADDSVLERLNSVLEPERRLSLAEKGGSDLEQITAHPNFFILATMNPGGDYGKKELSPALRNRFTMIWVPSVSDLNELKSIALERIADPELSGIVDLILKFWEWFNNLQAGRMLSVRDLLSWVAFIKVTKKSLQPDFAFLHGAFLVLLDGLSLGTSISKSEASELRHKCLSFLLDELKESNSSLDSATLSTMESFGWTGPKLLTETTCTETVRSDSHFGIHPFYIEKGHDHFEVDGFEFMAPTTRKNALRVLRAMQLAKPVLLEGSPGVGKTSLIVALGKFSGHTVVRINLSEQTDIMDLLGSDLPVESDEGMKFSWSDGILLQALKKGYWVLLDELNLAPQSVLEGLNAILDHRAEVFVPELGLTFKCPPSFRVFACQNPSSQGGGRKGLPKSFLNRFTKVYVDELVEEDYVFICSSLYPSISRDLLSKLILFNKRLHEDTMLHQKFGRDGFPWEFNLRDVTRSCQLIEGAPENSKFDCFLNSVYIQRMRTSADRQEVIKIYQEVFGLKPFINMYPRVQMNHQYLVIGDVCIRRNFSQTLTMSSSNLKILPETRQCLEAVACCVQNQWLSILIGSPSSGKTSLIRLLAGLTGNQLNELNLSSGTDISEILGCFEQYNAFRNYQLVIARVEHYINEYCSLQLESLQESHLRRKDIVNRWLVFLSSTDYYVSTTAASTYADNWKSRSFSSAPLLVEIILDLRMDIENNKLGVSWSTLDLDVNLKMIRKLQDDYEKRIYSAKFEWVTGLLIKAIENGEWIVLENANLCNPTVLDRINSLVEPSGSITVNECGIVDGKPLVLHPHPGFRMFLTVKPGYGEVSRAMRNRGVEIYTMPPYWLLNSNENHREIELKDARKFLVLSGVPFTELIDSMAQAHIFARDTGMNINVKITYLELSRWVQLFQRLLTNGNRPLWSLQISWEHTYLSSLGEVEGKDIVRHAIDSFLSVPYLASLIPGSWPAPLNLHDFVSYSKEATVKQNCMYLEFLAAQNAIASAQCSVEQTLMRSSGSLGKYSVDMKMLRAIMFPKSERVGGYSGKTEYDHARVKQMIIFAANWTIEQATKHDLELYLLWFSWFGAQLQPVCQFFSSYVSLLKRELEHPIWKYILGFYSEIKETTSLPLLSLELVELSTSDDMLKFSSKLVTNAIKCVILLRVSMQQWNDETEYTFSDDMKCFKSVLKSLRKLEEEVLQSIGESPSFDRILRLYNTLLEDHILLGKCITSSQFEFLLITWRSLVKNVAKLQQFFPREVENFHKESKNLGKVSSWSFQSQKSLLWVHGGHPYLPASADLYNKQCQLLNLCELVWPRKTKKQIGSTIEDVISCNPELRTLAMQGVCMSTYIIGKADEDESSILQQLEEMHQMLLRKVEHEKNKLEISMRDTKPDSSMADISSCCIFSVDILCRKAGFGGWRQTLPINDHTSFFLDVGLLQNLAEAVTADEEKLHSTLLCFSANVESALNFSLNFSSRPPTDFLPHQKILWTLDAWASVDDVNAKISSFVLEMWFRWHTSLWKYSPVVDENVLGLHGHDALLPDILFQPIKMIIVDQLLRGKSFVRDYYMHKLQLRVASRNLWQSSPTAANLHSFLLSAAHSLFRQIIFAHKKSFEADKYAAIKHIISSLSEKMITQDDINVVISLLESSSHPELASLMALISPLLSLLNNIHHSSTDSIYELGCAWLSIGGLRHFLLICCDDLDPVMKYSFKHTQLLEKLASLELEIEVRNECVHSAGCLSSRNDGRQKSIDLKNLHAERKRLQRQIVFRSDPGKFLKLKYENKEFTKLVFSSFGLAKNVQNLTIQDIIREVHNWQETASRFIDRLSNEYSAYVDIVQPVQAAVYEMKLGLSLVLSSALRKRFLEKVGQANMEIVLGAIYSFMRFPRSFATETVSPVVQSSQASISTCDIKFPTHVGLIDTDLLESLVCLKCDFTSNDGMASIKQMKAALHTNILLRVAYSAAETRFLDRSSFMLLDKIFKEFANFWMNMKDEVKTKEEQESQQYKFKPRAIKIDNIVEIDISTLGSMVSNETFTEWQEFLSEGDSSDEKKAEAGDEALEDDWNFLQESILIDIVHIHISLFGSEDLVRSPGSLGISEADHLSLFKGSYAIGVKMIKSLEGALPSSLDAKLTPEHLLRLSLDYEKNFIVSHKSTRLYNFYKDSNAPVMAKMVEPLASLKERILILMTEWDDHPALQKILDVIDMILAIPLGTPLAKALSALQFLLNRVQILRETVSKFPLSDRLEPILALVLSWKKLEFESWPALLDEVQAQYEINAGKLWFPLYSILGRTQPADLKEYSVLTSQSLKEYIETSNIGEFKKRLQLLFAMHGHIDTGITQGVYLSCFQAENEKILYNIFGFYVQSLPLISESINAGRKSIELELKDLLRLCRWERSDAYLTMDNSKKTRQKFKKIIQKYNDLLQEPVMLLLKQEAARRGIASQTTQDSIPRVTFDKNVNSLKDACDQPDFRDEDRSAWIDTWKTKTNAAIQNLQVVRTTEFDSPDSSLISIQEVAKIIKESVSSPSLCVEYQEERREVWDTIRKICETAIHCGNIWKEGNKSLRMRKALSDLLKCLDSCGLSKHRSTSPEGDQLDQPSYNMQHLLLTDGMTSVNNNDKLQTSPLDNLETEWRSANQNFFRSISSVRQLRQICHHFHKDFTLEQVTRSLSYLDHLIAIQQEQRTAAYDFAGHLNILKKSLLPLENLFSTSDPLSSDLSSFPPNKNATFNCMWQQKQLFDDSCSLLHDLCLLLQTVESSHLDTCRNVIVVTKPLLLFIEEFVQYFQNSKESLDNYLLGKDRIITSVEVKLQPNGVTKQMEQFVCQNFSFIREFEERVSAFRKQDVDVGSVAEILFGHLESIFVKGKFIAEEYESALQARNHPEHMDEDSDRSISGFAQALEQTYKDIMDSFSKVGSSNSLSLTENSLENICTWKAIFESNVSSLKLKEISDGLVNTIQFAGDDVNHNSGENLCRAAHLKHLYSLLDPTLTYGHGLLLDYLVMHRAVSQMTDELAKIFASLYNQGYPASTEEQGDETGPGKEAPGTGIGDGAGKTDVSDQITDEDQVMVNSEKPNEEDAPQDVPSKTEKGIEMETDFDGETFSVSEGSSDDEKDENGDEDEKNELPKEIGDTGDDSEIVGAKPWDEEDDDNGDNKNPDKETDKYESGPSVKDNDPKNRELRGKDETAPPEDNNGELDKGEPTEDKNGNDDEGQNPEDANNQEDDMIVDKDDAFAEPTGLNLEEDKPSGIDDDKPDEEKPGPGDDVEMDQQGDSKDDVDDGLPEEIDVSVQEENKKSAEEGENEEESDKLAGETENIVSENKQEKDTEMNPVDANNSEFRAGVSDLMNNQTPNAESATRPVGDSQTAAGSRDVAQEAQWSNCNDTQDDVASMRGLPNSAENEIAVTDSSKGGKVGEEQPKSELPQPESSSLQKVQPNPCRNIGDALDGWKDRIKVSVDLEDNKGGEEIPDDTGDDNAAEYGFTLNNEKGTAQALGTATTDQTDSNINGMELDKDDGGADGNGDNDMEIEDKQNETRPVSSHAVNFKNSEEKEVSNTGKQSEVPPEVDNVNDGCKREDDGSLVTMKVSNFNQTNQFDKLSVDDDNDNLGKVSSSNTEEMTIEIKNNASNLWRRYELRTTRLCQELCEQLRLVMEPTLASKLQGDYKTGKRINMKKVIPYIASHYRKDKIWLRRTRPNKRDYQVVIAVDDSSSMSESNCGDMATEALVTVCRAMSQLEVGNMAVASYGKMGNIKLLHEFDQPFTGEAGAKMVSSLTFQQDNSYADKPMVDLLKYLNNMLDDAAAMARLPSGHNPLQQLVLIIADGKFSEKNMKQYVRDLLSKKRMVAVLILDRGEESIMDLQEMTFYDKKAESSLYLNSFPFPYYVVLRNIEALPSTLADLLRQWFELMQYSRD